MRTIKYLIFLLLCAKNIQLFSSELSLPKTDIKSGIIQESVILLTDRVLYASGEDILFKGAYNAGNYQNQFDWSTVLYLELIRQNGSFIAQAKYPLIDNMASGTFNIPDNLLSGVYYLKAYTKWMRNYPTKSYSFIKIKVVNPRNVNTELAANDSSETMDFNTYSAFGNNNLKISTNKPVYQNREKVQINIQNISKDLSITNYFISVVQKGASLKPGSIYKPSINESPEFDSAKYLPEIDGISISGRIVSPDSMASTMENTMVNMVLLDSSCYMSSYKTDANGNCYFSFPPSSGLKSYYVTASGNSDNYVINLDKDFCDKPLCFKPEIFRLSKAERKLANSICINAQISQNYTSKSIQTDSNNTKRHDAFYGSPKSVIYPKEYIALPTLEEFIFEIVPEIIVFTRKKIPKLYTTKHNSLSSYPMLVLVDNIPIIDISAFIKLNPKEIERIEIIDRPYIVGSFKYQGIIHVYSVNKDLAGLDLPKNSMFFQYKNFEAHGNAEINYNKKVSVADNHPDRRNCLYWNPSFQIFPGEKKVISLYTSDTKGEYELVVYGISSDNKQFSHTLTNFTVE